MTLETQAPTDTLLVLTQNAWGQAPGWERRKARLVRKIAELRPHVVGLQEVHAPSAATGERSQAHEIAEMVGGYDTYFAPGRVRELGREVRVAHQDAVPKRHPLRRVVELGFTRHVHPRSARRTSTRTRRSTRPRP